EQYPGITRDLGSGYISRLILDLAGGPAWKPGLLAASFRGVHLGNFDVIYDPDNAEQISIGQLAARGNRAYFDTWASFPSRSARQDPRPAAREMELSGYRIDATVNPDLSMDAVTRVKVTANAGGIALAPFEVAREVNVTSVKVDGAPAAVFQADSDRSDLNGAGNHLFLVEPPVPLRAGSTYEFEFHTSGRVIHDAGDKVFFISARANWYPMYGLGFSTYDLRFRYPHDYDLVSAGEIIEEKTEGDWKITHRRTSQPVRIAAFNMGDFQHERLVRGGYIVDVCANRKLEASLQPRPAPIPPPDPSGSAVARRRQDPLSNLQLASPDNPPDPTGRVTALAGEVAAALEFMASKLGPPALPHLTVSPIPGTFGQGFPGLIYLSTLSYLRQLPRTAATNSISAELFFQDVLQAHETAHQWWGNRVIAAGYRDNWLMEALANYTALLYLEKRRGERALEAMLDSYRESLLLKNEAGEVVDSAGPIVLGTRLESSIEPRAWRAITYGKGSWIMQMLRRRMGDERFFAMLGEITKRYDHKEISTEQFRELASAFLPPKSDDPKLEAFFDQWIYDTGIPAIKMSWSVKGAAPNVRLTGKITQSGVSEDFSALVPVEIQIARGRSVTQWVRAADGETPFTIPLKAPPLKVTLDPHYALLRR
ncbi:MAG: hypothetical protein KGN36_11470, partial [Acidobacteriota bacterium]|nr:hypothetical protein [Acidobacteriota bacterium]